MAFPYQTDQDSAKASRFSMHSLILFWQGRIDFEFQLPGGERAEIGVERHSPQRGISKDPLVLKADFTVSA